MRGWRSIFRLAGQNVEKNLCMKREAGNIYLHVICKRHEYKVITGK